MTSKKTGAAAAAARSPKAVEKPETPAAKEAEKTVQQAVETAKESAVQAVTVAETAVAKAAEKVEKRSTAALKGYGDLVGLQQETFDAVIETGSIIAKGYEAIGKEFLAFTQSSLEANLAAAKAIFGAKSLQEWLDTQAGFARESLDKAVAESAKLSEMTVKMTSEAAAPIQARVNAAVESVTKQIAA